MLGALKPGSAGEGSLGAQQLPAGTCLLLETSGSDGAPKQVPLTQAAVRWQLEAHLAVLPLEPDEVRVACLPWTHAFGVVLDLLLGLAARQTIVLAPLQAGWTVRGLTEVLDRHDASWWCTVPRVLELVVRHGRRRAASPLHVLVGGAAVSPRLVRDAGAFMAGGGGGVVHVGYGLTEAGPGLAIDGRLLPGVEGEVREGSLWVRSPAWCAPLGPEGWCDTGDLAALDGGGHLEVIGRASRVVKGLDGQWVCLDAIEAELAARFDLITASVSRCEGGWRLTVLTTLPGGDELNRVRVAIERRLGSVTKATEHVLTDEVVTRLSRTPTKHLGQAVALLAG
jgi:long-subunit acyl-CoA synthetase (AMP-forming)